VQVIRLVREFALGVLQAIPHLWHGQPYLKREISVVEICNDATFLESRADRESHNHYPSQLEI
jgi:hypothetical protein